MKGLKEYKYRHLAQHSDITTFVLWAKSRFISRGHLHRTVNSFLLHNPFASLITCYRDTFVNSFHPHLSKPDSERDSGDVSKTKHVE